MNLCKSADKGFCWRRLASAKWEDAWVERLRFLGPARLAIFAVPGSRSIRIEAYALDKREAGRLVAAFGGQVRKMRLPAQLSAAPGPPLVIRDRLVVVSSRKAAKYPDRAVLIIPAAMAFGTGHHATTATCLRMVADFAAAQRGRRWEALDLGTGTGILALAARRLGAARCDAWDFDPVCVRAARGNARLNGLRGVPAARVDVTAWTPARQWDLVTANLFSTVLISSSAAIAAAVRPGGRLVLSGMLAPQAEETLEAFRRHGLRFHRTVTRGKWVTALASP